MFASTASSLMALSAVSNECNFVRPNILPAREMLEIKDGRHPLVASVTAFVPNSTSFEGEERLVVLTGPNASGKSVYLKQVCGLVTLTVSLPAFSGGPFLSLNLVYFLLGRDYCPDGIVWVLCSSDFSSDSTVR